ncbi:peptide chain release factor N(5)-glutamine methyltransferase [Melissococcus plutonius]|uniref:Release factor glutamine methyltransferase n=1 Tax=Melissococcus plutonius (strain ATCC 35311 / DSM 29964 / CIP 104052 / LMG 20360 / NCIMB 702443) TaxID=940190 RepID=F3YBU5_MELPT|nr:peptide chain release factor N(5)-glutamine methyltransferase [Melissococcus plutonius]AIM25247.1 release factor glutamine methyltransferase PrmC [Melissococcus plutonius S1]KMT23929.1 release factor glutamine methyltransferase PrmC [Melissococcus plutonius]KMT24452.1 release factor glutamine methyltransferase PrmC [Melissococcus plutonius]KMT26025.1 release factor glutamine methyltransferase PrmC [Melissococcus plutonius]KMT28574.1 release factor glutamine methyltransferase PrmC [Melissoco
MENSYFEVLQWASSLLIKNGQECHAIYYVFLKRKNWEKIDWLQHMKETMSKEEKKQLETDLSKLLNDYPPQYLLGETEFYGLPFLVNEHTLIPRPETEELVDYCLKENEAAYSTIVDVGTGTGAIAISLKHARPQWQVTGIDISKQALIVAQENAKILNTTIDFLSGDLLEPLMMNGQKVDMIISNPPYISKAEKNWMDRSVIKYEPALALFADQNGLAIYQRLAEEAKKVLKEDGKIYLEIGFQQGKAVQEIFQQAFPTKQIIIKKDLAKNDRIVAIT